MKLDLTKSSEALQTSLLAIKMMTPGNRKKFYSSEEGKEILKGLFLEAENDKHAMANGMNWSQEEIEATIIALRNSSEDDWKIFLQLLPGPVQAKISEHFKIERQNNGIEPNVVEKSTKMEKGAKIGTAGYEIWLSKKRTHNKTNMEPIKSGKQGGSVKEANAPLVSPKLNSSTKYNKFLKKKVK